MSSLPVGAFIVLDITPFEYDNRISNSDKLPLESYLVRDAYMLNSQNFTKWKDNFMKFVNAAVLLIGTVFALSIGVFGQTTKPAETIKYDAELAKKLGGSDNGMKTYVLVILKTGPKDGDFKGKDRDDIFAGHMANINRLADAGKLAVAGPFMKNDKGYRGLYIFNSKTIDEAQQIVETDPAVKSGILVPDMTLWYGSASLMATPEVHKKITKPNQ